MGWADNHISKLLRGETVSCRPRGNSMKGKIESGNLCTLLPITKDPVKGDIVLCKVKGQQYLHLISAVRKNQFQISNNRGKVNGWVGLNNIYGILVSVDI